MFKRRTDACQCLENDKTYLHYTNNIQLFILIKYCCSFVWGLIFTTKEMWENIMKPDYAYWSAPLVNRILFA